MARLRTGQGLPGSSARERRDARRPEIRYRRDRRRSGRPRGCRDAREGCRPAGAGARAGAVHRRPHAVLRRPAATRWSPTASRWMPARSASRCPTRTATSASARRGSRRSLTRGLLDGRTFEAGGHGLFWGNREPRRLPDAAPRRALELPLNRGLGFVAWEGEGKPARRTRCRRASPTRGCPRKASPPPWSSWANGDARPSRTWRG